MEAKRGPFGYEHKHHPVLSRREFAKRMARSFGLACAIIFVSLIVGMCGYRFFEGLAWIDAFVNAAMILGGMGPVDPVKTDGGKIFAGCYALYSGLVVIVSAGILFAPAFHRMLHKFHADAEEKPHKD